jgi:DNA transformation protein
MDRDFLEDLFFEFGPVSLRRMFSGYGVSVDGINFALVLRGAIYFRVDAETIPRFEDEGSRPFQYDTRSKVVTVGSYWQLPDRLYDDPEELAQWARSALAAAERAALAKRSKATRSGTKKLAKTAKPRAVKEPPRKRGTVKKKR